MSDDARRIAFTTRENASGDDDNGMPDAFVLDRDTGVALRVSLGPNDEVGLDASVGATLSADGHLALFTSSSASLWAGDDNWRIDAFLREISAVAATWTN
jgi:hypothetical protein